MSSPFEHAATVSRACQPVTVALLRVFGRYAWAQPRWLDRILPDVRFGHS